ncbi:MAG TPA: rhomboid family intramembrane serine protease, partial [Odoribacter splanchnicus]|nr:rhomboid family intramembrane serine protease [Odoribacter splanchnicus]
WFFIVGVRRNRDFASGIVNFFEGIGRLFQRKKKMRVKYKKHVSEMNDREYNAHKKNEQERINEILDKISRSGYESLTREEKAILFKAKN